MKNCFKRLFFILAINLSGWGFDRIACGAEYPAEPFRVALIRSSSMYLPAAMIQDQAMRESLVANIQRNVELYVDSLDTMRFPSAEFESQFLRLQRLKYQGRKIDLLMAVGPDALRFTQRHRADIWPGVPIVFYSVAEDSLQGLQLQPEVTGTVLAFDLPGTIELALGLQANAKRIVVVSGTSNYDQNWLRRAREALRKYENRFDISYWINQRLPELLAALRKLPPDTIVLYLSFSRDAAGDSFVPRDIALSLAEASSAPVYGILGTYLGQGVVGGSVPSFAAHGKLAGEIAMRVLSGQKAGEIPVQPSAAAVPTLDWRQLQRWNISESRLPPGAIVHFRPPSLWSEYKLYVIGAGAIVALQGLMIGSLLLQRSARRRAEEERRTKEQALSFSEARYRAVVEDQTELICRLLPDGTYTFVNDAYCRYFQRSREELLGSSFWGFIPVEGHRAAREFLASITPEHPIATREHEVLGSDGELRWQQWRDRGFFDDQGRVVEYQAVGRDITERKSADDKNIELLHDLGERVKELTALHRAAGILQNEELPMPDLLQQFVAVLPPAWQYPEITSARIRLGELEFATPNFKPTPWLQRADFSVAEGLRGAIEVVYLEERPAEQEGPFLTEERNLIDSLAEMLRTAIERRQAQEQVSLLQTITMEVGAADDLSSALKVVLRRVCEKTGWLIGQAWIPRHDGTVLDCSPAWFAIAPGLEKFRQCSEAITFPPGMGLLGRVWSSKQPAWGQDVTLDTIFSRAQVAAEIGLKVALAVPILNGDEVLAVIEFFTREPRREDEPLIKVITAVAAQLGLVIERKRADEMLRENETVLRESYDRIQDLAGRLITAQEAERSRIAGELHDDVNQQLAGLSIALSNVKRELQNGKNGTVQEEITRLQQRTVDLADVIRNLSHELHPGVLQHAGLSAALRGHCAEFGRQHEIEITLSADAGLDGIPDDVALCLYRVAQEALRNIAEHAGARKAQISLRSNGKGLELLIADDGRGFDLAEAQRLGGLGLISLDERVRLIGGNLAINAEPQRGTEVRVRVPLGRNR